LTGHDKEAVPNRRHTPNPTRSSRQYEGLLTEVNAKDDNDSEAEARHAGVLPDAGNPGSTGQAWMTDSDSEVVESGDKGETEEASKAEDEGEGEGGDDAEGEGEGDARGAKPDAIMLDLKESSEEGGANTKGNAEGDVDDAGEDNDNDNDNDNEATKTCARRFLSADSNLLSDDGEDSETDGEGDSGAIQPQRDANATMWTADGSDDK
ncbi:hypothetical protein FRC10_005825, partial [Ceratobasidium sp. 414]